MLALRVFMRRAHLMNGGARLESSFKEVDRPRSYTTVECVEAIQVHRECLTQVKIVCVQKDALDRCGLERESSWASHLVSRSRSAIAELSGR